MERTEKLLTLAFAAALFLVQTSAAPRIPQQGPLSFTGTLDNSQSYVATGKKATCSHSLVAVDITSTNQHFTVNTPANQYAATEIIQELFQNGSTYVSDHTVGTHVVSGAYNISVSLCYPTNTTLRPQPRSVQLLTHGAGVDKKYWDLVAGNSYVDAAAEAGYATLSYDRLGVGDSDHPDPINIVQTPASVEVLHALIHKLRQGAIGLQKFDKVICVSHSFGSILQVGHDAKYPDDCTAVIATGISDTLEFVPAALLSNDPSIANLAYPQRFANLSSGYLVNPTAVSFQQPFFRWPFFRPAVFEIEVSHAATYSLGEYLTSSLVFVPATNYTHPLYVMNGDSDVPFCSGNCTRSVNRVKAFRSSFYPEANQSATSLIANTGHSINAHVNAPSAFEQMLGFLGELRL